MKRRKHRAARDVGISFGPSMSLENDGIRNYYWEEVAFGDGFATLPDPVDSQKGYAMSQGGNLIRYNNNHKNLFQVNILHYLFDI